MTTSYSGSGQPAVNSQGQLTWNPEVGLHYQPALNYRESYGGIVRTLQDVNEVIGGVKKAYPHNFAGIIAAIQDLSITQGGLPPVTPGPNPGGGILNPGADWVPPTTPPREGDLWFDTRQGRLFCYVEDEWVQTNGADGLATITQDYIPPNEETPAPGQFWYVKAANSLYIHDGSYVDTDGNLIDPSDPDASPLWRLVNVDPATLTQTTATLPLAVIGPRDTITSYLGEIITAPDAKDFSVQKDYNEWVFQSLVALESELVELAPVIVDETKPDTPKVGQLWYDTATLDMSVWYEDGDSGQWVPVSTPYTYDEDLDVIRRDLSEETRLREVAIQNLYAALSNLDAASNGTVQAIQQTIAQLQTRVQTVESVEYITKAEAEQEHQALEQQIAAIVIPPTPDLTPYATVASVDSLTERVNSLPTTEELNSVSSSIPNVTSFVTQADIDSSIANITTEYLPRTGGELTGSFIINKTEFGKPAFDFSNSTASSQDIFKIKTIAPTANNFSTFGATNSFWEYAWQFSSNEDFCWIYNDANKVFSITKDGPACSQLYIGDFNDNDNNGRTMLNRIDVRDRLTTYQSAFEGIRQAISNSTDYDSLKAGLLTALSIV